MELSFLLAWFFWRLKGNIKLSIKTAFFSATFFNLMGKENNKLQAVQNKCSRRDFFRIIGATGILMIPDISAVEHPILKLYRQEFKQEIKPLIEANLEIIGRLRPNGKLGDIEALEMYYPIYRTAESAYQVPWYYLWVVHDAETTMSTDPNMNRRTHPFRGAMQRNSQFYGKKEVEAASRDFRYLADLPQNHPADWSEIFWAALKMADDAKVYQSNNPSADWLTALKEIQKDYCRDDFAVERIERIDKLENIIQVDPKQRNYRNNIPREVTVYP